MNNNIYTFIEKIAEGPDKSFASKRELIQQYKSDTGNNLERSLGCTPYVEFLDIVSHIPNKVIRYINTTLNTNRKQKKFNANKVFKEIVKKISHGEHDKLYYQNVAPKILSQNISNEDIAEKDVFQNTNIYSDFFTNDNEHILSKERLYVQIYKYCKMVENNVKLYNEYISGKLNELQLLTSIFQRYKDIDFDSYGKIHIGVKLTGGGILELDCGSKISSIINNFDNIIHRSGFAKATSKMYGIIVILKNGGDALLEYLNLKNDEGKDGVINHELLHIYNEFYQMPETIDESIVLSKIYTMAKDEILAKIRGGRGLDIIITSMNNSQSYDYFEKFSKNNHFLKTINHRAKIRKDRIDRLKQIGAPEVIISQEQKFLDQAEFDKKIFQKKIMKQEKDKYLQNINIYILQAYKFILWAQNTGLVYDPFVVLANTQMKDRSKLNQKVGIK